MEIKSVMLCDWATVREGLLHILGGGITRMYRPVLPAPLGVTLVLQIDLEPEVAFEPHEVHLRIVASSGQGVGQAMAALQVDRENVPRMEPGEHLVVPLLIPLHQAQVPSYGRYDINVDIDLKRSSDLSLWILHPDELTIPPLA